MRHDDTTSPAILPGRGPRRRYYDGPQLSRVRSVADLRARAHKLMPRFVLEYLEGGAGEEASLMREREAWADWRFLPHMLRDVSHRSAAAKVIGRDSRLPLAIAPTGLNGLFGRHSDIELARAAARFGVPFIQSTMSNETMEDVAAAAPGLRHWWQLYVFGPDRIWQALVDRADACGCEALVLTVNSQVYGMREWDDRTRIGRSLPSPSTIFDSALHPRWAASTLNHGMPVFANVTEFLPKDKRGFFEGAFWIRDQMPTNLSWQDVGKIRARWTKPFFVKGLLHPDDVRAAMDAGVDGVILGTHGGRQADWSVAALDVLPQVRKIVPEDRYLFMSGGIRRGSDVLKALALGADTVLCGRAPLYGLCAHGEEGARKALEILETEMLNDMGQIGVAALGDLGPDVLVPAKDPPAGQVGGG